MANLALGRGAFDATGDYIESAGRGRYHQVRGDLGLTLSPVLNRDGTVTVVSSAAGPSNARTASVLFSMNGDVVPLDNLTSPAQRETLPLPPPPHYGGRGGVVKEGGTCYEASHKPAYHFEVWGATKGEEAPTKCEKRGNESPGVQTPRSYH